MEDKEYLVMDDSGNIPEKDFTPNMDASVETYLKNNDSASEE